MLAILIGMVPKELQEIIFQMGKLCEEPQYREVRDRMICIAGHQMMKRTPVPGEVGIHEVEWKWGGDS